MARKPGFKDKKRSPPNQAASVSPRAGLVLVGRFGAAVGLRGEIRLQSFTQDPLAIETYGALTDAAGVRSFKLASLRAGGKGVLVARIEGVADRTDAEALTNIELFADRANMPAEDDNEFYVSDLIGMSAATPSGEIIGSVVDVPNYGAGDILEVLPSGGGETLLFPFTRAVVPEIDFSGRRLTIVAPVETIGEPETSGDA